MKGVRYYLPRPFLHLKQSVPVSQRASLMAFSHDRTNNSYLIELPQDAPLWVRRVAPRKLSVTQALAASVVPCSISPGAPAGGLQSDDVGGGTNAPPKEEAAPPPQPPAQTIKASTGDLNDTDPVTRLGELMEVVYLPDFDEQYVIRPRVGFTGQAEIETRLRNGWAAETFKPTIDNSQLIPHVVRQVEKASEAAAGIATTWLPTATLGLPPGTSLVDKTQF